MKELTINLTCQPILTTLELFSLNINKCFFYSTKNYLIFENKELREIVSIE